jgi:hypothetical protein
VRASDTQLFDRLVRQFEGLKFTDEELRMKRFHAGDPRGEKRYEAGPPPAGVDLIGFEFFYEVPQLPNKVREEMLCMFGNHRHFHGAAFSFSDGSLRCVGRYCFQELAEHTGKDVALVKCAVRHLTERQGYLSWFDRTHAELRTMTLRLSAPQFADRCAKHDRFFDRLRRVNPPASKFAAKIAIDHGRVLQHRLINIKKTVRRETFLVELRNWQVFRGIIMADRQRAELLEAVATYGHELDRDTNSLMTAEFKSLRQKFKGITEDFAALEQRLNLLSAFCQGGGLAQFVELWNGQAQAGFELGWAGEKLISGVETGPVEIPLAA